MPELKEPGFFQPSGATVADLGSYERLFDGAGSATHRGEASPSYSMFPVIDGVPEAIASKLPDVRLIYLVREPVDRMVSAYLQARSQGWETRPLSRALLWDYRYLAPSQYMLQVSRYLRHFDRSQILVVRTEDLSGGAGLDQVLSHLGLATGWRPEEPLVVNRGAEREVVRRTMVRPESLLRKVKQPWATRVRKSGLMSRPPRVSEMSLDPAVRRALADTLRADVEELADFMGSDFDAWGLV